MTLTENSPWAIVPLCWFSSPLKKKKQHQNKQLKKQAQFTESGDWVLYCGLQVVGLRPGDERRSRWEGETWGFFSSKVDAQRSKLEVLAQSLQPNNCLTRSFSFSSVCTSDLPNIYPQTEAIIELGGGTHSLVLEVISLCFLLWFTALYLPLLTAFLSLFLPVIFMFLYMTVYFPPIVKQH